MTNKVQAEVKRQLDAQLSKGEAKYGHGIILEDGHDWLQESIEECVDMLQYLCAQKLERESKKKYVEYQVSGYVDTGEDELKFYVDGTAPSNFDLHGLD